MAAFPQQVTLCRNIVFQGCLIGYLGNTQMDAQVHAEQAVETAMVHARAQHGLI